MLAQRLGILPAPIVALEPNVEVFRTNIRSRHDATAVVGFVRAYFPHLRVTVDLSDCDRVLRVQAPAKGPLPTEAIRRLVVMLGFAIEPLAD